MGHEISEGVASPPPPLHPPIISKNKYIMLKITYTLLLLIPIVHGYYSSSCGQWPTMKQGILYSPGNACLKPNGYNTNPTEQTTPAQPISSMTLSSDSIGIRINVGGSPSDILYTSFPTNGITQSTAAANFAPLDLSRSSNQLPDFAPGITKTAWSSPTGPLHTW